MQISIPYSNQTRIGHKLFICKVLAGKMAPGNHDLKRPPHGFDSVGTHNVVVVFDRMQCYPEYIITLS